MNPRKLIGGYSSQLAGGDLGKTMFDLTLREALGFLNDESKVDCLRKLLEHLLESGVADAAIAVAVSGNGTPRLLVQVVRSGLPNRKKARQDEALDAMVAGGQLWWQNARKDGPQELDDVQIGRVLDGALAGVFTDGIVVRSDLAPEDSVQEADVFIGLFGLRGGDLGFLRNWVAALLAIWSHGYKTRTQRLESALAQLESDPHDSTRWEKFAERAEAVQYWVTLDHLTRAAETVARLSNDRERANALKKLRLVQKQWRGHIEKSWPSLTPSPRVPSSRGWIDWRLEDSTGASHALRDAARFTSEVLKARLTRPGSAQDSLDALLPNLAVFDVLSAILGGSLTLPAAGTDALWEIKGHLLRFVGTFAHGSEMTPEAVEAIIWAVAEHAYQTLKVDRRLHIASHMRHAARGEPSLHMTREFYRDHFFHTLEVCFLGRLLADTECEAIGRQSAFPVGLEASRQWTLAALLHDIGYAVDITKGVKNWLEFFTSESFSNLADGIGRAMKDMSEPAPFQRFYLGHGFEPDYKPWEDHGLVGAYHVHTLAEEVGKSGELHPVDLAVRAIAKHHCDKIKIDYRSEPLSALLALSDAIQTWRRPHFRHFSLGPAWMLSMLLGNASRSDLPTPIRARLTSNLRLEVASGKVTPVCPSPLVLRLTFAEEVNYNAYVFNMWLDLTRNFQRIDFSALPFDLLVQVETPTYRSLTGEYRTQMGRLFDAAHETHMAYLDNWFPKKTQPGIPAVTDTPCPECLAGRICHHVSLDSKAAGATGGPSASSGGAANAPQPTREMLTFNLKKMTGTPDLMTEDLTRFRADLQQWKRYREDRGAVGDYSPWTHRRK